VANIILRPQAQADVDAALAWYDRQGAGLAQRLLEELDIAFGRIRENPGQFPFVEQPVRRTLLHKFPYSVYFVHDREVASVLAVVHQKRHPETWKHRDEPASRP
jgi:plasmid stabilization system protein ParE